MSKSIAKFSSTEEMIRHYIPFVHGSSNGWNRVYCEYCGDGKRAKGPRGGWFFQDNVALYHCFNNGCECNFDPDRKFPRSKDFTAIATSFGIPEEQIKLLEFVHKHENRGKVAEDAPKAHRQPLKILDIPSHFYLLSEAEPNDETAKRASEFLIEEKHIDPASYPFYLSTGKPENKTDVYEMSQVMVLKKRLIIPAFRGENMIYYQARRLDGIDKDKYLSCNSPRSNIIYNMDRLYEDIRSPLFVTEGFFDAHHLNGVSTMENFLSAQQIEILDKSPRKKVIVPDWKGDSGKMVQQALNKGWSVSFPRFGSEVKDVTEAVVSYGRLFVAHEVVSSIKSGLVAKAAARLNGM